MPECEQPAATSAIAGRPTDRAALGGPTADPAAPLVLRPTVVPYLLAPLGGGLLWLLGAVPAEAFEVGAPWLGVVVALVVASWFGIHRMRFVVDDRGVERRGMIGGPRRLAWAEIDEYRYAGVSLGARGGLALSAGAGVGVGLGFAAARAGERFYGDAARVRHQLTLRGPSDSLGLSSTFGRAGSAVARILPTLHHHFRAHAPARLVSFGPIRLAADAIGVAGKPPLPRAEVELVHLQSGVRPRLRVMKHGKVLPWASFRLDAIPNAMLLCEEAVELGYPCEVAIDVVPSPGLAARLATRAALPAARVVTRDE